MSEKTETFKWPSAAIFWLYMGRPATWEELDQRLDELEPSMRKEVAQWIDETRSYVGPGLSIAHVLAVAWTKSTIQDVEDRLFLEGIGNAIREVAEKQLPLPSSPTPAIREPSPGE